MYRLALLLAAVTTAHGTEPVERLLAAVQEQYRTASSFHFAATYRSHPRSESSVRTLAWDSEGPDHVRLTLSGVRVVNGYLEYYDESSRGTSVLYYADAHDWRVHVVADGGTVWTENPVTHRSASSPSRGFAADEIAGAVYGMFVGRYRSISSRAVAPRLVKYASVGGVHCVIVESASIAEGLRRRYWIDENSHLVRKEEARDGKNSWSMTFTAAETGRVFAPGTFRFQPARSTLNASRWDVVPVSSPLPDCW